MMSDWLLAIVPIAVPWAIYVEQRLAAAKAVEEKIDKIDLKVEKLVDHLIGKAGSGPQA